MTAARSDLKARRAAADLVRRLRNPPWPESIPLGASEAMEEAARLIESGLKPAPPAPLWYVATGGEKTFDGGYSDCLVNVAFFSDPLAYGRACRAVARLHSQGEIETYTMGQAAGAALAPASPLPDQPKSKGIQP